MSPPQQHEIVAAAFRLPRKLLFIDDNADDLEALLRLTKPYNCESDVCADGERGLALAADGDHDLVFVDLKMPGLSGVDVVVALKALRRSDVKKKFHIVTLSGEYTTDIFLDLRKRAGFVTMLTKPVCFDHEMMDEILGTFGIERRVVEKC